MAMVEHEAPPAPRVPLPTACPLPYLVTYCVSSTVKNPLAVPPSM